MFCPKCGTNVNEGAKFCPSCGNTMSAPAQPSAPANQNYQAMPQNAAAPQYAQQPVQQNYYAAPKKKSNIGLIIGIIAGGVAVLAGVAVALWLLVLCPKAKVQKALKNEDYATVCEYYDDLDDDYAEEVSEKMLEYAGRLKEDYFVGEIEYKSCSKDLEMLEDSIFGDDNEEFNEITSFVSEIEESRYNLTVADLAFAEEDYQGAMEFYSKVSPDDKDNYKLAQKAIEICQSFLVPPIVGTWRATIDLTDFISGDIGEDISSYGLYFSVDFVAEFYDDNTAYMYVDVDQFKQQFSSLSGILSEYIRQEVVGEYGVSSEEIDEIFESVYGESLDEFVAEYIDDYMDDIDYEFSDASLYIGEYSLDGDTFTYTAEGVEDQITVEVDGDTLYMDDLFGSDLETYEDLIDLPIVFTRE